MAASREQVERILAQIQDPHVGRDLVSAGWVRDIRTQGEQLLVEIVLGYPAADFVIALKTELVARLAGLPVQVEVGSEIRSQAVQRNLTPYPGIKNIIAIASGKGGVGKSTLSVNLALALAVEGAQVALLDADIYGPSQPRMLGYSGRPHSGDGRSLEPVVRYGIKSMSVGYLVDEEQPMIWRGPMVTQALNQLLRDTHWGEIDYMIVDLPPGTGDIQLTLCQQIPVSGAVIITTPQDIALLDARKALRMFERVEVGVLGVVENMSTHICSNCGHEEAIFGAGGGRRMAEQYEVPYLGELPLDIRIRAQADSGRPTVVAEPAGELAQKYRFIARSAAARLALATGEEAAAFPEIVIVDD